VNWLVIGFALVALAVVQQTVKWVGLASRDSIIELSTAGWLVVMGVSVLAGAITLICANFASGTRRGFPRWSPGIRPPRDGGLGTWFVAAAITVTAGTLAYDGMESLVTHLDGRRHEIAGEVVSVERPSVLAKRECLFRVSVRLPDENLHVMCGPLRRYRRRIPDVVESLQAGDPVSLIFRDTAFGKAVQIQRR
jgi:hypothetical protein